MRIATLQGNKPRRRKWLARLSKSKRDDLIRLEKRAEEDSSMREFRDSLDALIPFTGLWPAMQLGTFHRLLTIHCPEVDIISLHNISSVLTIVLGNDAIPTSSQANVELYNWRERRLPSSNRRLYCSSVTRPLPKQVSGRSHIC